LKKVLLAMSGGVDSSTSALILKQRGYEVIGVTMQLFGNEKEAESAKRLCEKLSIEHHILELRDEFKRNVIDYFIDSYKKGITPNPCVVCNKKIKFGKLYEFGQALNCDYFATGHYAKTEYDNNLKQFVIKKATAKSKDQTYVLYGIRKELIEHIIFPLGDFESKEQIRKIALDNGLEMANKKDSQEICFIPDNDYSKFIGKVDDGNIVDKTGRILGKHKGYINYTIGQRKGLGLSNKTPLYVIGINSKNNEIIVGDEEDLYTTEVYAENVNLLIPVEGEITAKIRYSAKEAEAQIYMLDENKARFVFKEPQKSVTPGQSIVFYKGDILAGGGVIMKFEK